MNHPRFPKLLAPFRHFKRAMSANKIRDVGLLDVVVCSPGGVATTTFLNYLSEYVKTNCPDDGDSLKHVPRPENILLCEYFFGKIIYIYGDPEVIVDSLERRKYVRAQGSKLGCLSAALLPLPLARKGLARAIVSQINSFLSASDDRLLCVEFNEIWEKKAELANFIGVSQELFVDNFPPRRSRETSGGTH